MVTYIIIFPVPGFTVKKHQPFTAAVETLHKLVVKFFEILPVIDIRIFYNKVITRLN
jgi:hypothetical protein